VLSYWKRELFSSLSTDLLHFYLRHLLLLSDLRFDEVHFGGFASKYINQKFFMDVHPPLAKLMIAGTAYLAGFDGKFDFKDISK